MKAIIGEKGKKWHILRRNVPAHQLHYRAYCGRRVPMLARAVEVELDNLPANVTREAICQTCMTRIPGGKEAHHAKV